MAHEQDESARSHRLLSVAAVALLSAAAALGFGRVFQGHPATFKLLAAAVLSVCVAALLERRGPLLSELGSAIGLLLTVSFLVFPKTAAVIFPTMDTFRAIGGALHHVGEQARVQVAPTPPLQPLLLAAVTAVWTAAYAAHALAIRSGSPILAAIPPGALLAFADVLLEDGARPSYAALFLVGALAVLFMDGLRRVRHWGPLRPWPGHRGRARLASTTATKGARRVTAFALGAALLIPGVLPGFQSPALLKIDTSTVLSSPSINPLVAVTASLHQHKPVDLFLVRADQPAYWRWLSLDHFDGTRWTASDLDVSQGQVISAGSGLPDSPIEGAGLGIRSSDLVQNIVVLQDTSDRWLPMAFHPVTLSVGRSSVRYDPDEAAAVPEVGIQKGLAYTVRSQLLLPSQKELDRVPALAFHDPALKRYEELPSNTPREIYRIARTVTADAGTPFRKLLAIQSWLHTFTYDEHVSGATDTKTLVNFLDHTRRGFCQQFATAMAVLARALGYPARVAVGFTPGRLDARLHAWRVSTANAHAWVEILFPGYGWLAFEPTPTRDNPVADSYLAPGSPRQFEPCVLAGTCGNGTTRVAGGAPGKLGAVGAKAGNLGRRGFESGGQVGAPGTRFLPLRGEGPAAHPYRLPLLLLGLLLALALGAFLVLVPLSKVIVRRVRTARTGPPREVVLAAYRTFTGRAADLGLGRSDGETLREYRDRLRREVRFSDGHLEGLTRIATTAAYSGQDLSADQAHEAVADARRAIRDMRRHTPLGRRVVGLFRLGI
jgi:hypothetical protein